MSKRSKATGRFRQGGKHPRKLTVGAIEPTTRKGPYFGVTNDTPISGDHTDDSLTIGRRVTIQQGGLKTRANWCALQSGGLTPREMLRAATR